MDNKLVTEGIALLLLFAAFPLTSLGTSGGSTFVWVLGLLSLVAGSALPIVTRFMDHRADKPTDMGMEFDERTS
ncbi:MAG TPA: EmrB/QacA subfamily drug resistance transporter [Hyphomicrobiaceae bacterium]|nr:EmrB/QacA subfamily drug resistance transporter [Hyphomicrobiaceae bacterium]